MSGAAFADVLALCGVWLGGRKTRGPVSGLGITPGGGHAGIGVGGGRREHDPHRPWFELPSEHEPANRISRYAPDAGDSVSSEGTVAEAAPPAQLAAPDPANAQAIVDRLAGPGATPIATPSPLPLPHIAPRPDLLADDEDAILVLLLS